MGITMDLREKQPWSQQMLDFIFKEIEKGALINTAATEPKTGSPTRGGKPETLAVKQKGWRINGRKTFTTMSPVLNYFLVKASIEGEEEIGLFLIPRETSGLSIEETWDMIAMRGTGSHDLVLENVDIEQDFLVERLGGFKRMSQAAGCFIYQLATWVQPSQQEIMLSHLLQNIRLIVLKERLASCQMCSV